MSTQASTATFTKKLHVGKDSEGYTYMVEIELRETEAVSPRMTITHEPVSTYLELSICGETRFGRREDSFGQITNLIRNAEIIPTQYSMNDETRRELCELWDRWHLNGLKAACVHQNSDKCRADMNERRDVVQPLVYPPPAYDLYTETPYHWVCPNTKNPSFPYSFGEAYKNTYRDLNNQCPMGYSYGSAWLVELLPESVVADVRRIAGV